MVGTTISAEDNTWQNDHTNKNRKQKFNHRHHDSKFYIPSPFFFFPLLMNCEKYQLLISWKQLRSESQKEFQFRETELGSIGQSFPVAFCRWVRLSLPLTGFPQSLVQLVQVLESLEPTRRLPLEVSLIHSYMSEIQWLCAMRFGEKKKRWGGVWL